ncbi:MAG TPA: flagellar hook-length control protein FliK [bacterium]|nr:flagellar hook-length control protein FliK [bacterium]
MASDDNKVDNNRPNYRRETIRPGEGGKLFTPKTADGKSPFQKVMEEQGQTSDLNNLNSNSSGQSSDTSTREAVRSVASQANRDSAPKEDLSKKSSRSRDDERDDSAKSSSSGEVATPKGKEAEKRVVGRSSTGEREGGGEGGQGGFGSGPGSGRQQRGAPMMPGDLNAMKGQGGILQNVRGRFEMELQAAQSVATSLQAAPPPKPPKDPNVIPKAVLDQLVQYCRIVTKTDGDKELDMQLHDETFKGLKLKVSVSNGKVDAIFTTQSEEVLNLFNAQKAELRKALAEKGIDVTSINVVMV